MNDDFVLTAENYYSPEANWRYMSVHNYMNMAGHMGVEGCEARAMAELKGEWNPPKSKALMVGSYVDSYFEGTLEQFKQENPDIFTAKGELRAEYKQADKMITRAQADEYFMATMAGEKQKIMTASLFGCDWKIKMDSYIPGVAIVDLKTSANIHEHRNFQGGNVSIVDFYGYILQGAVYQEVVYINTGERLPFYLSFISKQEEPEILVVGIDDDALRAALGEIKENIEKVLAVKNGEVEPVRCEHCDYCKRTRILRGAIHYSEL